MPLLGWNISQNLTCPNHFQSIRAFSVLSDFSTWPCELSSNAWFERQRGGRIDPRSFHRVPRGIWEQMTCQWPANHQKFDRAAPYPKILKSHEVTGSDTTSDKSGFKRQHRAFFLHKDVLSKRGHKGSYPRTLQNLPQHIITEMPWSKRTPNKSISKAWQHGTTRFLWTVAAPLFHDIFPHCGTAARVQKWFLIDSNVFIFHIGGPQTPNIQRNDGENIHIFTSVQSFWISTTTPSIWGTHRLGAVDGFQHVLAEVTGSRCIFEPQLQHANAPENGD